MSEQTRRNLLLAACATAGTLAGCLDELSASSDDGESGNDDADSDGDASELDGAVTDDGTVDYPAFVDDEISVDEDEHRIEYPDPDVEFVLEAEPPADEGVHVSRELDTDARVVYVAPAYDEGFTYHVFANEAFVGDADWYAFTPEDGGGEGVEEESVSFEELESGIFYDSISPSVSRERAVVVADVDLETFERDEGATTEVAVAELMGEEVETGTPEVNFDISHERDGEGTYAVEFRHVAGDELDANSLTATVDGDTHDDSFETGSITVGETLTVEHVSEGETLSLVFDDQAVIAETEVGD